MENRSGQARVHCHPYMCDNYGFLMFIVTLFLLVWTYKGLAMLYSLHSHEANVISQLQRCYFWCSSHLYCASKLYKFLVHLSHHTILPFLDFDMQMLLLLQLKLSNFPMWTGTQSQRHFVLHLWWLSLVHLMFLCSGQYYSSTGWFYSRLQWGDRYLTWLNTNIYHFHLENR